MNTRTHATTIRLTLASALAITIAGLVATNASADVVRKITVNFAELNIDKPAGAKKLYKRLRNAAATVCGGRQMIREYRSAKRCYADALAQAVIEVNKPLLTELHGVELERLAGRK
jgi:UrcA family protein